MLEALQDADAAVIVTEWDEFRGLLEPARCARRCARRSLIDGRNLLDPPRRCAPPARLRGRRSARPQSAATLAPPGRAGDRRRPRGRRGHAAAPAHARAAEADAAPRSAGRCCCTSSSACARAGVERVDPLLRLPARRHPAAASATGARRAAGGVRRRARAARHRGRRSASRPRGAWAASRSSPSTATCSPTPTSRRRGREHRASGRRGHDRADADATTPAATASCATDGDGSVLGFLEKPDRAERDRHRPDQRRRLRARAVGARPDPGRPRRSRSSARSFPALVGARPVALARPRLLSDVGTPESYIAAHHDLLAGRMRSQLPGLTAGARCIDDGATVVARRRRRGSLPRRGRRR